MCCLFIIGKSKKKRLEEERRVAVFRDWLDRNCQPVPDGDYIGFEIKYREIEQSFTDSMSSICEKMIADEKIKDEIKMVASDLLNKANVFLDSQSPFNDENNFVELDSIVKLMKEMRQKYYENKLSEAFLSTVCTKIFYCFYK